MFLSRAHSLAACISIFSLVLASATAWAEDNEASTSLPPLTLRHALDSALRGNPELQSFAYELRVQQGRQIEAGLAPNPTLSLALEDFAGSGAFQGTDNAQATFALSQVIELGDKRARRVDAASAERGVLETARAARQLDVVAEVARRFIHVAADQEQLVLTRRATGLAEKTLAEVAKRVKAGKSPGVEQHRAFISFTRAQVEEEHAEHELLTSRRKLAAMWGETATEFGRIEADLYTLPAAGDFGDLVARLAANPDFTRFASEERLRDAELRLAQSQRTPNVELGAGIRRHQLSDDQAFVFSFTLPLPLRNRNQGAIAEAEARREQVGAEKQVAFIKAQAQLFELHQELRHYITEATTLEKAVLPQMDEALEETEYAYQRGRYSYLEWVEAQRELVNVRRAYIEAAAKAHIFLAEIERLTGEPLTSSGTASTN